jgi:hypothetical protein
MLHLGPGYARTVGSGEQIILGGSLRATLGDIIEYGDARHKMTQGEKGKFTHFAVLA